MSRTDEKFIIELLAECADRMAGGASVDACLAPHPGHEAELKPLLDAIAAVRGQRAVPPRSAAVAARSRAEFLAAARGLNAEAALAPHPFAPLAAAWRTLRYSVRELLGAGGLPRTMPAGLAAVLLVVLLSGLLFTGMVSVSASALPGDPLFAVRTAAEQVQLLFTFDDAARGQLLDEIASRRIEDARAIVQLGRKVAHVPLQGSIEAIAEDAWEISGLTVRITPDTRITGDPAVGCRIQGRATAPGDGSLIAEVIEVEPLPQAQGEAPREASPTAPPPVPTPSATATATAAPDAPAGGSGRGAPVPYYEPTDTLTPAPTVTPTASQTVTPSATPAGTATATATATPTATPWPQPTRTVTKERISGVVNSISGSMWTIAGVTVEVDGSTRISGNPRVGSTVLAEVVTKAAGGYLALSITELAPPEATPEPIQFKATVESRNGSTWVIGGMQMQETGETVLVNDPGVGDLVYVRAERRSDGIVYALEINALREIIREFEGVIVAMNGSTWQIDDSQVMVTGETNIYGSPAVGAVVEVRAREIGGRLYALDITVVRPAPTATPTATATTAAAAPTAAPTATPTPTAIEAATAVATETPTSTVEAATPTAETTPPGS